MKKVMVIIPALGSGGGERLAVSLISKMNPTIIQSKLVVLYPYKDTENARLTVEHEIDTVYLNKHRGVDLSIVRKLKKEIDEFKPDVIQTHLYVVAYVLLAAPLKIKKYHTVHNVAEKEAFGWRRIINRIAFKFGNFVPVAISPYCAKTIENLYGIRSENIPCIMNGVDTSEYTVSPIRHNGMVFINVGRLQTQKNQALLIKAFARVVKKEPEAKLIIVGEGELRKELEVLIAQYGIERCVSMPGQCNDVRERLNAADVFVQSSDYEGLPIAGLEAMACGLPLISTKAGGTVDIIKNNENGFLVDIGDSDGLAQKMIFLIENKEIREKMGAESRKIVEMYNLDKCAQKYQQLYMENRMLENLEES